MNEQMIKKEVILPKLNHCNGDISKQWFVYFSVLNPATGRLQVFRKYEGLNLPTAAEREIAAKKLIAKWRTKLLKGWNPYFEQDKIKYNSLLKYQVTINRKGPAAETTKNFEYYSSRYLDFVLNTMQRRKPTYTCYKSKLRIFGLFLKKRNIHNVPLRFYNINTINDFNKHLQDTRGLKGKILNDYNTCLKRFFKYCIEEEKILKENPCIGARKYAETKSHHYAYNQVFIEKMRKIINEREPWLWLQIKMIFSTFLRPKELRFLQMKHFNWSDGTIILPGEIAKNKRDRVITLPHHLLAELLADDYDKLPAEYYFFTTQKKPGPQHASKNFLYNKLKKYLVELGLPKGYDLYSWKHTGVQQLARAGVDIKFMRGQLGHSSYDEMIPYIDELTSQGNDEIRYKSPKL